MYSNLVSSCLIFITLGYNDLMLRCSNAGEVYLVFSCLVFIRLGEDDSVPSCCNTGVGYLVFSGPVCIKLIPKVASAASLLEKPRWACASFLQATDRVNVHEKKDLGKDEASWRHGFHRIFF